MRRWTAVVVALVALVAGALSAAPGARADEPVVTSSKSVASLSCRDLLTITVKGSGDHGDEGTVAPRFRSFVQSHWPGSSSAVFLDYPAASTQVLTEADVEHYVIDGNGHSAFFESVSAGITELERVVRHSVESCPKQRIVVIGFSQGAQVATGMLASSGLASRINATLLLGNPSHYPGQSVRELDGQVDSPAFGMQASLDVLRGRQLDARPTSHREAVRTLLSDVFMLYEARLSNRDIASQVRATRNVIDPSAYPRTFSVCARGDLVCDFAPTLSRLLAGTSTMETEINQTRPIHLGYEPAKASATMSALLSALGLPEPTDRPTGTPTVRLSPGSTAAPQASASPRRTSGGGPGSPPPAWLVTAGSALAAGAVGYALGRWRRR